MGRKMRILIAEDHPILREGLRALLCADRDLQIVGEAGDGRDAIRLARELSPDLGIMDLSMPGMSGLDAIREIKKQCPQTLILVLTLHEAEEYVLESLQAGANGYLVKASTHHELLTAVKSVLTGKTYLSPEIQEKVVTAYLRGGKPTANFSRLDALTTRERQVLKLVAEGHTNKVIADYLFLSVKTVEKHRANLMNKLGLHNASTLTAFAIENGLLDR